jgi:hypothetical protein
MPTRPLNKASCKKDVGVASGAVRRPDGPRNQALTMPRVEPAMKRLIQILVDFAAMLLVVWQIVGSQDNMAGIAPHRSAVLEGWGWVFGASGPAGGLALSPRLPGPWLQTCSTRRCGSQVLYSRHCLVFRWVDDRLEQVCGKAIRPTGKACVRYPSQPGCHFSIALFGIRDFGRDFF